jgi:nucleoid DNA-binding protein
MGKITLTNIAEELALKSGLSKDAADNFMRAIVDTIEKGLHDDNIVKIKGLGTFKLMEVSDRGSIDVNTGERITIKGYTKVTFTPDSAMKEFINRPFAHFEPTELNEGFQDEELIVDEEQAAANTEELEEATSTPLPANADSDVNTDNIQEAAPQSEELQSEEPKAEETAEETAEEIEVVDTDIQDAPAQVKVAESENVDSTEMEAAENIDSIEHDECTESIEVAEDTEPSEIEVPDKMEDSETMEEEEGVAVQTTEQEQTPENADETSSDLQPENGANPDVVSDNMDMTEEKEEAVTTTRTSKTEKETKTEEKKTEEKRPEKPKSRRGCRVAGCLFGIVFILTTIVAGYFAVVPTNEKEKLNGQSDITVNPHLEKDLDKNWEDETLHAGNNSTDALPSHNEPKEETAENQEAPRSDNAVESKKAEQKATAAAAPATVATPDSYSPLQITASLAAKSIKDITVADTTDYTIGSTLTKHELKSGETIIQLARKYYGDKRLWPYIVKYNNITDFNKVAVGMIIEIPVLNSRD